MRDGKWKGVRRGGEVKGRLTEVFLRVASEVPLAVGVLGMPEGVIPVVEQWWPEDVFPLEAGGHKYPLVAGGHKQEVRD